MKLLILSILSALAMGRAQAVDAPFTLALVPSRSSGEAMSVEIGGENARRFYTVLTNVSKKGQEVFETWNSWGYYNVEFEVTMADGKKLQIKRAPRSWLMNFSSTFFIPPGERFIEGFPFGGPFNDWEVTPDWPKDGEYEVTLKAIYKVEEDRHDREDKDFPKVWYGRVESPTYKMKVTFSSPREKPRRDEEKPAEPKTRTRVPDEESNQPSPKPASPAQ